MTINLTHPSDVSKVVSYPLQSTITLTLPGNLSLEPGKEYIASYQDVPLRMVKLISCRSLGKACTVVHLQALEFPDGLYGWEDICNKLAPYFPGEHFFYVFPFRKAKPGKPERLIIYAYKPQQEATEPTTIYIDFSTNVNILTSTNGFVLEKDCEFIEVPFEISRKNDTKYAFLGFRKSCGYNSEVNLVIKVQ